MFSHALSAKASSLAKCFVPDDGESIGLCRTNGDISEDNCFSMLSFERDLGATNGFNNGESS